MQSELVTEEKVHGKVYEVAYLVSSSVSEEKVGEVVSRIKMSLEKQGAFVLSEEFPRFRQLAYTLVKPLGGKNEKHSNSYFGWVKFEIVPEGLTSLKVDLEGDKDIVRFLLVKTDRERKVSTRAPLWRRDAPKREAVQKQAEGKVPGMTEAEIDKTIEELIAE